MITTVALANTFITSHNYHFFFMVRTFKIYFLSNFQECNTVLTVVTMLYIRSPEFIPVLTGSFYPLTNNSSIPPPHSPWEPPFYSLFLQIWLFLKDSICK